jgi:2-polyprenyl-3-methyl-5-hydroxy-6-metoxy-1,4-benzoquinol methylase
MQHCNVCIKDHAEPIAHALVHSNVRQFRAEQFRMWRCPDCGSLHAADEVDLASYYRSYPFHAVGAQTSTDWMVRAMYGKQLARLKAAGLREEHRVLDYGCGGGALVRYLRSRGYRNVHGFDEYGGEYADRSVLADRFDLIITQDVLEHVPEPWRFLETLAGLIEPGGAILIGTPNAEALDLAEPEAHIHTLHQPYHRHIFSKKSLLAIGDRLPWTFERYYPTMYANTFLPFVNGRFMQHYMEAGDNTVDVMFEPIQVTNPKLFGPMTLFWGLFGALFATETDVMVTYRANR